MPRLLVCGFESFPAAPVNPAAAVVRRLDDANWSRPGVEVGFLTVPVAWTGSAEAIEAELARWPADGVLVAGVATTADGFRVETLARNAACATSPDAFEALWPHGTIHLDGAEILPATAPCQAMTQAIARLNLPVETSSNAGDYLCNFTLYRLLAGGRVPRVGFLHVPQAKECATNAAFRLDQIEAALRAAASAFVDMLVQPTHGDAR